MVSKFFSIHYSAFLSKPNIKFQSFIICRYVTITIFSKLMHICTSTNNIFDNRLSCHLIKVVSLQKLSIYRPLYKNQTLNSKISTNLSKFLYSGALTLKLNCLNSLQLRFILYLTCNSLTTNSSKQKFINSKCWYNNKIKSTLK